MILKQLALYVALLACCYGLHVLKERDRTDPIKPPALAGDEAEFMSVAWDSNDGAKHYN